MSLTVLENGSEQTLKPDLLYKIVETKAPQNYQKDETPTMCCSTRAARPPDGF